MFIEGSEGAIVAISVTTAQCQQTRSVMCTGKCRSIARPDVTCPDCTAPNGGDLTACMEGCLGNATDCTAASEEFPEFGAYEMILCRHGVQFQADCDAISAPTSRRLTAGTESIDYKN